MPFATDLKRTNLKAKVGSKGARIQEMLLVTGRAILRLLLLEPPRIQNIEVLADISASVETNRNAMDCRVSLFAGLSALQSNEQQFRGNAPDDQYQTRRMPVRHSA
jgi:hypothetical protein